MKYSRLDAKDYARETLRGIWVTPLFPMHEDGSLDGEGFRANLRHWIDELNVDGVCLCNKLGEYGAVTAEEWKRLTDITVEECDGDAGIAVSCADASVERVIDLANHARHAGADFVVVHAPALPLVTDRCQVVHAYYEHLCDALDIGIVFWSHPDAGYVISPEMCLEIAELPGIVACKYSVSRPMYTALSRMAGDRLIVSNGSEVEWLDNMVELGWQLHFASALPLLMQTKSDRRVSEYTSHARAGRIEEARRVYDSLEPVRRALRASRPGGKPHAHQKYWLDLLGRAGGVVRRPMLELSEEEKQAVRSAFGASGLAP